MKDIAPFPSMAIAAFAEHLIQGRRVVVFGDSTSDLPEVLIERGARLVHVYDGDLSRVAEASARGTNKDISYAPLGQSGAVTRDGAFDFGVVLNAAAFEDGKKLITRLRRALAPRGIAIVATPNPEAASPLLADAELPEAARASGPSYYDLYEWVTAEFDEVKMLGQVPMYGYTMVDFGAEGEPDFSLDTSFLSNGAEEPDWYLALASHFPVSVDAYTIVQIPRPDAEAESEEEAPGELEELARSNAQLEAEVARLRKVERQAQKAPKEDERVVELERALREREQSVGELEARLRELTTRAERAEAAAKDAKAQLEAASAVAVPEAPPADPREIEVLSAEVRTLEQQLEGRGQETARLREELRLAEKLSQELLAELETLKQTAAGALPPAGLGELQERVRRAEETEARRVADLTTAQWTIEQLKSQLAEVAASAPSGNA